MKRLFLIVFTFLASTFLTVNAQKQININNLKSNFAKSENKQKYYANLIKNCEDIFSNGVGDIKKWNKALRDAQTILLKNKFVFTGIKKILDINTDEQKKIQQTALEVAYTLYPKEFEENVKDIFYKTNDPISYAIATNYLLRLNSNPKIELYKNELIQRFDNFRNSTILNSLYNDLEGQNKLQYDNRPDLNSLLIHSFQDKKNIIYSFFRKNRNYPGISIIKGPDGKFIRNDDNSLFFIPQLAISFSNLPSYIPNGNTPQGIYSIVGTYISPTETIGPTPNILVRSPFEVSPSIFYHRKNQKNNWNIEDYINLIPKDWKNYEPIFESFYTGKSGRKLIIIHGSTDETKYFKNEKYFPLTPTRGCLSSYEEWDINGKCKKSDQLKLINAFRRTGTSKGFLVVVEIDNQEKPVEIKEIESLIRDRNDQ